MSRSPLRTKLLATAGIVGTALATSLFVAPAATATPTPSPSGYLDCIFCWTPKTVDAVVVDLGASVGSGVISIRV